MNQSFVSQSEHVISAIGEQIEATVANVRNWPMDAEKQRDQTNSDANSDRDFAIAKGVGAQWITDRNVSFQIEGNDQP